MDRKNFFSQGFTLIELLVVIAIIAILAALGLVAYSSAQRSARDAQRMSTVRDMAAAMEQVKVETGDYPTYIPSNGGSISEGTVEYVVPTDPSNLSVLNNKVDELWCIYYELEQNTKGNCGGCSGTDIDTGTGFACVSNRL